MNNKVIIITGAGSGLGEWMATTFAENGAIVILTDNNILKAKKVHQTIQQNQYKSEAMKMDVTKKEEIKFVLEQTLKKYEQIDVLVNNAAFVGRRRSLDVDDHFFDQMNDINVKGAFFCSQIIGEQMIKQRNGKIINMTSAAGKLIRKNLANTIYSMNKGSINLMTKALAEEWSDYDIKVNAIAPGYFRTDTIAKRLEDANTYHSVIGSTPLGKVGEKKDLVGLSTFLASDYSDFITGQIIYVDGGRTIL